MIHSICRLRWCKKLKFDFLLIEIKNANFNGQDLIFNISSRLPFDLNSPLQCATAFSALFCAAQIICLLIGTCWLLIAIVKDIKSDLRKIDQSHLVTYQGFCNIIQMYSDARELSANLNPLKIHLRNHILCVPIDWSAISTTFTNLLYLVSFYGAF